MKSFNTLTKALIGLGISAFSVASLAAPTAGTSIGNQAAATYTDASAISRTATSNTVTTIVQQVAAFTLTSSQTKNAGPGAPVSFTHTITNTGNGSDTFALTLTNNAAGDNFDLTTINTFIDADCNGVADNATPVTSVGPIAPGASVCVVVSGSVPATATSGQTGILTLAAASGFTPATTASNLDTVTVTSNAVIGINKAISSPGGNPGSGPYTYTLTYTNTGNANASNVVLADVIPAGMTYTAASGRWSGSVPAGTALTDAAAGDPAGINYDFGVTTSGAITAVITSVPANSSGTLTFQVSINANQAPGYIYNTAKLCYNDGVSQQPAGCTAANTTTTGSSSSTPSFLVAQVAAVNANGSTTDSTSASNTAPIASATQGATVSFNNIIWNRGNGSDTFDITMPSANTPPFNTFPLGTTFQLFKADGVTPLVDTNSSGQPDTGVIPASNNASCSAAGGFVQDTVNGRCGYTVVLKATLPSNAVGGPFVVTKTATSQANTAISDPVIDTLTVITSSTVDLRNGTANTLGTGTGPEGSAVTTNNVNPGATTTFILKANNTSAVADTYNLGASTDSTFASTTLPSGWTVTFRADGGSGDCSTLGSIITNTGTVNASAVLTYCAVVSVPANAAAAPAPGVSLFFRVLSPSSGASDRKFDAVVINTIRNISISTPNSGQVFPGGSVVYTHLIINNGNVTEGDTTGQIVLGTTLSGASASWNAIVYWDKNNDGVLDASDPVVTDLAQFAGGTGGASVAAGLGVGEQARLFVKVLAPANAPIGAVDVSTLTATTTGAINSVPAPAPSTQTDTTTVIAGQVRLDKLQALDANCDGIADTAFSTTNITTGAIPGACIRYQITATNQGTANVTGLVVSDSTPSSTTYHVTVPAATTAGSITAPAGGAVGTVQATVGTLTPTGSAVVTFGVRINP